MAAGGVLARLTKARIALASVLSAAAGALVLDPRPGPGLLGALAGVLLLAMGAAALNQWQERDVDARMPRTRRRPIPAGELRPAAALALALALVGLGTALQLLSGRTLPALVGLATVGWYNGVYTPLKRVTALAVVPGGLVGVGAPAIGWTAAGGRLDDPRLLALAFFFFLWQVPHFWLLLLRCGDEYRAAGLPSLRTLVGPAALARLTLVWLLATAAAAPLLALFGLTRSPWAALALLLAGLLLAARVWAGLARPAPDGAPSAGRLFGAVNVFACGVMLVLVVESCRP